MLVKIDNQQKYDINLLGGKAHSLSRLSRSGVTIPPTYVITTNLFKQFVKDSKIAPIINKQISLLSLTDSKAILKASSFIKELMEDKLNEFSLLEEIVKNIPNQWESYAVRSSATDEDGKERAWAGQLKSSLAVRYADITNAVKETWKSLFSPCAITYRLFHKLQDKKISVAVIVQAFVETSFAGVIFSKNPISNDCNEMILEYVTGCAEKLVSGSCSPGRIHFDKILKTLSHKSSYLDTNIEDIPISIFKKLCLETIRLENKWTYPLDIEWGINLDDKKLNFLQARPITSICKLDK